MDYFIDHRDIFIKGKKVYLKALTRDDVLHSNWYGWFNDEDLTATLQKHYLPNTKEIQLNYLDAIHTALNKMQLGICDIENKKLVGVISLNDIDFINSKAEISVVIGEKEGRNIAFFIEACQLVLKHAFFTLNLNRIYGGSISKELVLLMCRVLGFTQEGIGRSEVYKNGIYMDIHKYAILREEFKLKTN